MAGNGKPDFVALGQQIEEAKKLESQAKKLRNSAKETLFKYINSHWGEDSAKLFPTFDGFEIGRERRVSVSINMEKLEENLAPETLENITYLERKVDEDRLKVALKDGIVDGETIAKCIDESITMAIVHRKPKVE